MTLGYKTFYDQLPNGLRVLSIELPHLHTVSIALYVRTGPRFETPRTNGLSHFVEHMLFRGNPAYPSSYELNRAFEALGSSLHGETGREHSMYQFTTEPKNVEAGVALLADFAIRPSFPDIDTERAIILEEASEDYNEDGRECNSADIVRGLVYAPHPLSQRIIGSMDNLSGFRREQLVDHHASFYTASNCLLAIAGPISSETTTRASQPFAAMVPGSTASSDPVSPTNGIHYQHVDDHGSQTAIDFLWPALPESDPDFYASSILLRILDDGLATRLHHRLSDQSGLAYSLGAAIEPFRDTALFEIAAASTHAKVSDLTSGILELVDELARSKVGDEELARAKSRFRFDTIAALDDATTMLYWIAGSALDGPSPALDQRLAQVEQVTADDVLRVARQIFRHTGVSLATVGTVSDADQAAIRRKLDASQDLGR